MLESYCFTIMYLCDSFYIQKATRICNELLDSRRSTIYTNPCLNLVDFSRHLQQVGLPRCEIVRS